jgi:hypothetical protein
MTIVDAELDSSRTSTAVMYFEVIMYQVVMDTHLAHVGVAKEDA